VVLREVLEHLSFCAQFGPGSLLLETAGGVHSPAPSGNSQADVYRPLRLPILLVADHLLGGISSTISAFESLHARGYDVDSVLVFEDSKYRNHEYFQDYFRKRSIPTMALPQPPPRQEFSETEDRERMAGYYEKASAFDVVEEVVSGLFAKHAARVDKLESMASRAHQHIWYPFTQHQGISPGNIVAIDSAYGDFFQTYMADSLGEERGLLQPAFDGSASWWTQGVGHGNPDLSLAAAYAAGRYGHVMFAGMAHEPAVSLAELLLQKLGNPRLHKVFYSDNGSTGMEVAMKMALTAASERYGWDAKKRSEVGVLGLKGSYHGDTIGAMDCSEPSTFNEKVHWYQGRGYWFNVPQVKMKNGVWIVEIPPEMKHYFDQPTVRFSSLSGIFDIASRKDNATARGYVKYVRETLVKLQGEGKIFGALIMEPVILGAGGMILV
jgi:dethiobiotin synthetase/adenosylmethionine--8-amino-7-oxononanoate aminotransferase